MLWKGNQRSANVSLGEPLEFALLGQSTNTFLDHFRFLTICFRSKTKETAFNMQIIAWLITLAMNSFKSERKWIICARTWEKQVLSICQTDLIQNIKMKSMKQTPLSTKFTFLTFANFPLLFCSELCAEFTQDQSMIPPRWAVGVFEIPKLHSSCFRIKH